MSAELGLEARTGRDPVERDFARLWTGQTISLLGTQVSTLAIPLTAALTLDASPAQMGLLGAAQWLPFLLLGLPAGAWIDRRRRRQVMIAADVGRAISLGVVPVAAVIHVLSFPLLYVSTEGLPRRWERITQLPPSQMRTVG